MYERIQRALLTYFYVLFYNFRFRGKVFQVLICFLFSRCGIDKDIVKLYKQVKDGTEWILKGMLLC